jgi:hypothetical protein
VTISLDQLLHFIPVLVAHVHDRSIMAVECGLFTDYIRDGGERGLRFSLRCRLFVRLALRYGLLLTLSL